MEAYDEGWNSFYENLENDNIPENPYLESDPRHDEWDGGYHNADASEAHDY